MGRDKNLKPIICPSCAGALKETYTTERDDDEDVSVPAAKCTQCGKIYDRHTQEYYGFFADRFTRNKPKSIFKLGLKGKLKDKEYEIIGRLRYQDEDECEPCTWDEWVAVSGDGVYCYFAEEEGEVFSYEEYIPQSIDLEHGADSIEFEGKRISKSECAYTARIVYAKGELPWTPEIGEAVTCYDFKKDGTNFTIEHSEDEVSITKAERLSYGDIIAAFNLDDLKTKYDDTVKKQAAYKKKAWLYAAAMCLSLAVAIFNCSTDKEIPGIMSNRIMISDNKQEKEQNLTLYTSQVLYGPFNIAKPDKLYDIIVFLNKNLRLDWQSFRLLLIHEKRLTEYVKNPSDASELREIAAEIDAPWNAIASYIFTGDFWDEEGRDSEGAWHESDQSSYNSFIIDETGNHYALLELYNQNVRDVNTVTIKLSEGTSYRAFVVLFFVFGLLFLINRRKFKKLKRMRP